MKELTLYGRGRASRRNTRFQFHFDYFGFNGEVPVTFYIPDNTPDTQSDPATDAVKRGLEGLDMLVFDYAPNLRIAGTHHALNDQDKSVLKELIEDSDFIAVEYDEWRLKQHGVLKNDNFVPHLWKRGYKPAEGVFYASLFDSIYLELLCKGFCENKISANKDTNSQLSSQGLQARDTGQCEFEFCIETAKAMGKAVHLVDPIQKMLAEFVALDPIMKLRHIVYLPDNRRWPKTAKEILDGNRDRRMLAGIEEAEGPMQDLERRGTLFVGHSHAMRYLVNLVSQARFSSTPLAIEQK